MTVQLPTVSIVIPALNESLVIDKLLGELLEVLADESAAVFEIIVVDDGSTDDTWLRVCEWHENDSRVRGVSLSRNFGHQAAVSAGLKEATGDAVIVMDADLQDDPLAISLFLDEFRRGFEVVYAVRTKRAENWWKRLGYWAHYRIVTKVAEVPLPLDAGDFGLMSRRVVDEVNALPEHLRYVRGLRAWVGFKQTGVVVPRRARGGGESKYSFRGLLRLSTDGLLGLSVVPLRLSIFAGALVLAIGIVFGGFVVIDRLVTGNPPAGFASLALLTLLLNGAVLVVLGIVGEYVGRIYMEVKRRPSYIVRDRLPEPPDG
jgi:polyisoprenyl-phosphate glycosyltransferase